MYRVECKGGGLQNGKIDSPLEPFIIEVKDEEGEPVAHVPVEFRVAEGKGRFDYKDERTDLSGSAVAEFVPEGPGRFRVECFVGEDGRESIPFKGVIDSPEQPKAKRKSRQRTKRPSRAAVPPVVGLTPAPSIPGPPPLPAEARTEATPPVAPAPQPPPQAAVTQPAPSAAPAAVVAPKPEAPKAPPVHAQPKAAPKPAQALAATVVIRRPTPAPARAAAPVRREAAPRPKRKAPPPKTTVSPVLIGAVVIIYLLLAPLAGAMVAMDLSTPRPVVDCSRGAWHLEGNVLVFRGCVNGAR